MMENIYLNGDTIPSLFEKEFSAWMAKRYLTETIQYSMGYQYTLREVT